MKKTIGYITGALALAALLVACPPAPDSTPPTISLSSSVGSVATASSITLTASASDNIGVSKVEFYDGALKLGEDSSAPFEQTVALSASNNGSRSYSAKAYDAANNSATSNAVAVAVSIPSSKSDIAAGVGSLVSRGQSSPNDATQKFNGINDELNLASISVQFPGAVIQALTQIGTTTASLAKNAFDPRALIQQVTSMTASTQGLSTRTNYLSKLPTGNFDCTGTTKPCPNTDATTSDLIVNWKTKLGKTAVATIDWDASSSGTASAPIVITTSEYNTNTNKSEVPTKAVAKVTVDGKIVANLQFEATWENSFVQYSIGGKQWAFSFRHFALSGALFTLDGATKLIDISKLNYDNDPATGIKTSGDISVKLSDAYRAKWDISIGGTEEDRGISAGPSNYIPGFGVLLPISKVFKAQGPMSLAFSLEIGSGLYSIDAKATGWSYQPYVYNGVTYQNIKSLDGISGNISLDGKLATFAGKLDGVDANHNCIPFENLNLTFSDGTATLEQYLIDKFPTVFPVRSCP
jgi:hypothetical protein